VSALALIRRLANVARFGLGSQAREKKRLVKAESRQKVFESDLWDRSDSFAHRQYDSYAAYLAHQSSKLEQVNDRLIENEADDLAEFERRFGLCDELRGLRNVLCLGARLGTEVKALHRRGLFAVGIDLNPGPDNRYVLVGDFHALVFGDGSVDAIYTNALDHVFDLTRLITEVARVLVGGGILIADVLDGYSEGFTPGRFESMHWRDIETLCSEITRLGGLTVAARRPLGQYRRDRWTQVVFRKPA
jgi:SAM-dependent methyltransferase